MPVCIVIWNLGYNNLISSVGYADRRAKNRINLKEMTKTINTLTKNLPFV